MMNLTLLSQASPTFDTLSHNAIFWLVVVGVVAFVVVVTLWTKSLRKASWKRFAKANGLIYTVRDDSPLVFGQLEGRDFELRQLRRGSDHGTLGLEEVSMKIGLHTSPAQTFTVASDGRLAELFHQAIGDDRTVEIPSDPEDEPQRVTRIDKSEHPPEADLPESCKEAIAQIVAAWNHCEVVVSNDHLAVTERTSIESLAALNERATTMTSAARLLESPSDRNEQSLTKNGTHAEL